MRTIRWVLSYLKEREKFSTTNLVFRASSAPFMLEFILIVVFFFMQTHEKETQLLIHQKLWSVTLFTISMCCSRKKGFRHLFKFIIIALTCTYVASRLAHFTHSASIVWIRKTQRSLVRGCGTSIGNYVWCAKSVFVRQFPPRANNNNTWSDSRLLWSQTMSVNHYPVPLSAADTISSTGPSPPPPPPPPKETVTD